MTSSMWSRGGAGTTRSTGSRGGGSNNSYSNRPSNHNNNNESISSSGFRQAKGQVGKIPSEMELLQSPSRGIDDSDPSSLKNPEIQNRFRQHIAEKLLKFDKEFMEPVDPVSKASALSIILLDFRKLREGITSSGRVDLFTAEVYESSARLAVYANNMQQLGACLPHLVFSLHPALLLPSPSISSSSSSTTEPTSSSSITDTLSSLSLSSPPIIPELHSFYQSLYLLYLITYLSDLPSFHSTLSTFLPSSSTSSNLTSPDLIFVTKIYSSLLSSNYSSLSRLIFPPSSSYTSKSLTSSSSSLPPLSSIIKFDLQLSLLKGSIPKWRERAWERIERSYKVFDDLDWLARALLLEKEGDEGVKAFLKEKGKGVPS